MAEVGCLFDDETIVGFDFLADAEVLILYIPADKYRRAKESCTERRYKRGQLVETVDWEKLNIKIGALAVKGWANLTRDGEEVEFNPENRDRFMTKSSEFSNFIHEKCSDLEAFQQRKKEIAAKKLSSTSDTD
jgi:hypothetical protein